MPHREVVLVTGSSGFIGAPLIRALARHRTVVGFDRTGDPNPPIEADCVCVDLAADDSIESGLARVRYAYGERLASVVHPAAFYDFSGAPFLKPWMVDGIAVIAAALKDDPASWYRANGLEPPQPRER